MYCLYCWSPRLLKDYGQCLYSLLHCLVQTVHHDISYPFDVWWRLYWRNYYLDNLLMALTYEAVELDKRNVTSYHHGPNPWASQTSFRRVIQEVFITLSAWFWDRGDVLVGITITALFYFSRFKDQLFYLILILSICVSTILHDLCT